MSSTSQRPGERLPAFITHSRQEREFVCRGAEVAATQRPHKGCLLAERRCLGKSGKRSRTPNRKRPPMRGNYDSSVTAFFFFFRGLSAVIVISHLGKASDELLTYKCDDYYNDTLHWCRNPICIQKDLPHPTVNLRLVVAHKTTHDDT